MITVMFLETSLRIGGTETVLTQLIERLHPERFRPILCCFYEPGVLGERLIRSGFTVYHSLAASRWDPRLGFRLWKLMKKEKVDVLFIVNQPLTQLLGTFCGLLARIPVKVTAIRSTGKINRVWRRRWINRFTFPWIRCVTALSQTHKRYLVKNEKIDARKIAIIHNGVDLVRFLPDEQAAGRRLSDRHCADGAVPGEQAAGRRLSDRHCADGAVPDGQKDFLCRSLGIEENDKVVGIVAMLRPEKAHDDFLKAAAKVAEEFPRVKFLIVGDGPERRRLQSMSESLHIESQTRFLGARTDVPALISLFDVGVLCSKTVETFSNAVLEYMASAKPVVATRVGSLAEIVDHGKTGFLVEAGDWPALADRILFLLKNPEVLKRMGKTGRENVNHRYTVEQMVEKTETLFEILSEAGRGGHENFYYTSA